MMETMTSPTDTVSARDWWNAARPHTWANAFAPVIAGTGAAAFHAGAHLGRALLALIVSWALIVGVNYANDYSDGVRGTDDDRTGPTRLTASGRVAPGRVKSAAFISFFVAAVAGVILALMSSWWLIPLGAVCIAAAWFYTGGSNPYGYRGLGELAVFVFFGLVAVMGTEFTQSGRVSWIGLLCAVGVGSISAAVNLANNIRDIPTDAVAGKHTLAVRLGDTASRRLFAALTSVPFLVSGILAVAYLPTLAALLALPFATGAVLKVVRGASGPALIPVLGLNGRALLVWAALTALALFFGGGMWTSGA